MTDPRKLHLLPSDHSRARRGRFSIRRGFKRNPETRFPSPTRSETPIGKLKFFDGVPTGDTVEDTLRNPGPDARPRCVSGQYRRRVDQQRARRSGQGRRRRTEQGRHLRTVDGLGDAGGHGQHLNAQRLFRHGPGEGWADRHRSAAGDARLPGSTVGSGSWATSASPDRTRARAASIWCFRRAIPARCPTGISCSSRPLTATSCSCAARSRTG